MSQQQQQQQDSSSPRRHEAGQPTSTTSHPRQQDTLHTQQPPECTLYSLVQYECDLSPSNILCKPVFRLLKKCKGRPTVEVTPLYDPAGNILHG
ncbi:MAG: hypothetical protein J3R72DRAFT_440854 [Linnemannia gamsii]|nr:MAG: hypothetical protein J3R72DRAFT_440854 [Linnemannia gamsii]